MLAHQLPHDALLFAIPAGGVPVAAALAERLQRPLDVAVVSKITLPWNTEAGYGAVAFDGTVLLNDALITRFHLTPATVAQGIQITHDKVRRRVVRLRGEQPFPVLTDVAAVLVDDGLASGYTMRCAIRALRHAGATALSVAVPTAHDTAAAAIAREGDALYCARACSQNVLLVRVYGPSYTARGVAHGSFVLLDGRAI
jgi:predicted phosphoribosyltransferase